MSSEKDIEKFADWVIRQERELMRARYPLTEEEEDKYSRMSHAELLAELGVHVGGPPK